MNEATFLQRTCCVAAAALCLLSVGCENLPTGDERTAHLIAKQSEPSHSVQEPSPDRDVRGAVKDDKNLAANAETSNAPEAFADTVELDATRAGGQSKPKSRDEAERSSHADLEELSSLGYVGGAPSAAKREGRDDASHFRPAAPVMRHAPQQYTGFAPTPVPPTTYEFHTEQYDAIQEDGFLTVANRPLSTFSIDVDTASYSNVRRILTSGALPPAGAVRIEELINYFTFDDPAPRGPHPFAVTTEVADAPWYPGHKIVRIGLRGRSIEAKNVPPRNLVFLIDVSGSMMPQNKLPLVTQGLAELTKQLRRQDHVAICVYAGASGCVLEPTSGADRQRILESLGSLQAGGSTNGAAGIRLAYDTARRHFNGAGINRVILATDGDFNVGTTSRSDLVELIEKERKIGVFLTVLGVGMGNLKDATMEELADHGNGNYAYLDTLAEARKVLVEQAGGTLVTIAKDVKIQVEFNPAAVHSYRLIGYENRRLQDKDFNDDSKDAGEIGAGHSVTALYEVIPSDFESCFDPLRPGVDPLRYQRPAKPSEAAGSDELATVKLRYKEPSGHTSKLLSVAVRAGDTPTDKASTELRFSAAVAAFGMALRGSEERGSASFEMANDLARNALGRDPGSYRAEFLRLVAIAGDLSAAAQRDGDHSDSSAGSDSNAGNDSRDNVNERHVWRGRSE